MPIFPPFKLKPFALTNEKERRIMGVSQKLPMAERKET
jgi:hypothetical protein